MRKIETVLGPIDINDLGNTDCHEHLFIKGGMPVLQNPDFLLNDMKKTTDEVNDYKSSGGNSIIEMSPIDWGRDVNSMIDLARSLDINIIASTGFHKISYYLDTHWIYNYSVEEIHDLIVSELTEGMDIYNYSGPIIKRSKAKAGIIKAGTQTKNISAVEKKIFEAVAVAHIETGVRIMTHTDEGALALEQINLLSKYGVIPNSIAISHVDRVHDINFHVEIAQTGAFLEYDAFARVKKEYDKTTMKLIIQMIEKGYSNSILLGGDISRQSYWKSYGGDPGLAFVYGGFKSLLKQNGLTQKEIDTLYNINPKKYLGINKRNAK